MLLYVYRYMSMAEILGVAVNPILLMVCMLQLIYKEKFQVSMLIMVMVSINVANCSYSALVDALLIAYLVLQSGSVDITNLNTKDKPKEYSEYYKREVRYAAKNLFEAAETAISAQPSLKKVVIMCQTPRYDERSSDPLALKRVLADLFNQTLAELWLESTFKDKLVVGIHNLECTGGIREARYRDIRDKRYDGVHMYGPSGMKAYTISVLNILKSANILDQTDGQNISGQDYYFKFMEFQHQKRKNSRYTRKPHNSRTKPNSFKDRDTQPKASQRSQKTYEQRYTVPTSNIFEHLNW